MTPLFKKLNYKGQDNIIILNAPPGFGEEMEAMKKVATVKTELENEEKIAFILSFVQRKSEVDRLARLIDETLEGDGIVWFAYPKKSSKKYKAEISRDYGWDALGAIGLEAVRAVAIDQDWSALRFRRVEYIKTMKRDPKRTMTKKGKERTKKN